MKPGYTDTFQSEVAAVKYDNVVYAEGTYACAINDREAAWLRRLVTESFDGSLTAQHDFACGTGRAIKPLEGLVAEAHGYDTSQAMVSRAREHCTDAQFHVVSPDGPVPDPAATGRPALVTIFRLLLNTGPGVRERAVEFAAQVLPDSSSGLLVIENHGNRRSLRHLSKLRHKGQDDWFNELSHEEVRRLLARYDFRIESMHGFALLPRAAFRKGWLRPWAKRIDAWGSRRSGLAPFSTCLVYVARRTLPTGSFEAGRDTFGKHED